MCTRNVYNSCRFACLDWGTGDWGRYSCSCMGDVSCAVGVVRACIGAMFGREGGRGEEYVGLDSLKEELLI